MIGAPVPGPSRGPGCALNLPVPLPCLPALSDRVAPARGATATPPRRLRAWAAGLLFIALAACGGGGSAGNTTSPPGSTDAAAPAPITATAPPVPRAGITAAELALVVAEGDATSEAVARAYQRARGIPDAQLIRVPVPTDRDAMGVDDFNRLRSAVEAQLPEGVQATLLTFTRPSRVQGTTCAMSITSAMAFGYDAAWCGGCAATKASPYFDSESTRPWAELKLRPSMMLGAATLAEAEALIARGLAAEGSNPTGTGWLVRTTDAARSVRFPDWTGLPALWGGAEPLLTLRYVDAATNPAAQLVQQQDGVLFYFTGLASVDGIASNRWLPGAVADHLTSGGGVLPGGSQMPITAWLAAGATASYGTVEEPCNHTEKFPKVSVLLNHYLRGATVLEAYWKSVQRPGQGLFVGEPLARPWPDAPSATVDAGQLLLRSRNWRRDAVYTLQGRIGDAGAWQTLATRPADGPRLDTWRITLPAGTSALRVRGPCTTAPALTCTWGTDD